MMKTKNSTGCMRTIIGTLKIKTEEYSLTDGNWKTLGYDQKFSGISKSKHKNGPLLAGDF